MKSMSERLFQHRHDMAASSIRNLLADKWADIPYHQTLGLNCCPDCGLPTMRIVYQQSEAYTALCMSCGHAHRFWANSEFKAIEIFNDIDPLIYSDMKHMIGADYHKQKPYRNYYYAGESEYKMFRKHSNFIQECREGWFCLNRAGFLFMGYDFSDADWSNKEYGKAKKITW